MIWDLKMKGSTSMGLCIKHYVERCSTLMILFPQDFVPGGLKREGSPKHIVTKPHRKENNFSSHYLAVVCSTIYNFILITRHNTEYNL